MLIQNPSKIYKSDFRVWTHKENIMLSEIYVSDRLKNIHQITELIFAENATHDFTTTVGKTYIVLPLFGEITTNNNIVSVGEILTINAVKGQIISFKNLLNNNQSDVLIFELDLQNRNWVYCKETLDFQVINNLLTISEYFTFPNFIGLYEGRKEEFYTLKSSKNSIFAMVINGAFEFQNRLLETRDALLLWEVEKIELESLSENALIIMLEIP